MRWPISPFQGTRSRPSIFFPNFTHVTVRAPGWLAAVATGFGGPQLSSAILASDRNNQRLSSVSKHTALREKFLGAALRRALSGMAEDAGAMRRTCDIRLFSEKR